jgi:hypothetical protein
MARSIFLCPRLGVVSPSASKPKWNPRHLPPSQAIGRGIPPVHGVQLGERDLGESAHGHGLHTHQK